MEPSTDPLQQDKTAPRRLALVGGTVSRVLPDPTSPQLRPSWVGPDLRNAGPPSAAGRRPTVAELEGATAATEAVYADPDATYADLLAALEAEEAAYGQVFTGPCDTPGPEPEAGI